MQSNPSPPYLGICFTAKDTVQTEWAVRLSLTSALLASQFPYKFYTAKHYELMYARDDVVIAALKDGCRKILMWDTDVYPCRTAPDGQLVPFPEFAQHMASLDYPIVSGLMWLKTGMPNLIVKPGPGGQSYGILRGKLQDFLNRGTYVNASGLGLCMIDARVFAETGGPPYFVYERHYLPDGRRMEISEDITFFDRCCDAGFRVLVDGRIYALHEGSVYWKWENDITARLPL